MPSIGLMLWFLAREVLRIRSSLFIYFSIVTKKSKSKKNHSQLPSHTINMIKYKLKMIIKNGFRIAPQSVKMLHYSRAMLPMKTGIRTKDGILALQLKTGMHQLLQSLGITVRQKNLCFRLELGL